MDSIHAIYQNGVFKPASPVALPEGKEVLLQFAALGERSQDAPRPAESSSIDGPRGVEDLLVSLASEVPAADWQTLPADLTDRLDHYLYGAGSPGSASP